MQRNSKQSNSKSLSPFKVGRVFNPIKKRSCRCVLKYKFVTIDYPTRLNAMAMDPSKIDMHGNFKYSPGEIVFSVSLFKRITINKRKDSKIVISQSSKRPALILHAVLLMKQALGFHEGFDIDVKNKKEIRHCGFGSSSGLLASVACAINEAYGNPIDENSLIKYLAQNHGEEIDKNTSCLNPVQCIGGSAAAGICKGGLVLLAGESVPIAKMSISNKYKVVIGIPRNFKDLDSSILMKKEIQCLYKFIKTGKKYGKTIAYNILHEMLPAIYENNLKIIGDVIYMYRFKMGSIKNCSFTYKKLPRLCNELSFLKKDNIAEILSISSVGPAIFAVTKNPDICRKSFNDRGLKTFCFCINNNGYKVIKKISNEQNS